MALGAREALTVAEASDLEWQSSDVAKNSGSGIGNQGSDLSSATAGLCDLG